MSEATKDTIYIDIDDEITSVINKVQRSKHKILALVLPKRAAVFQSIVNMKLLKRTADEDNKRIVLITSEAGLLPLAGAVGLHVAKTLQSKPSVPSPPEVPTDDLTLEESEEPLETEEEPALDETKPVGELAGMPAQTPAKPEETIELDNEPEPSGKAAKGKKSSKKAKKGSKVPNFSKFRKRLLIAIGVVLLLIVGWVVAFMILPKAHIAIKTDTTNINTDVTFTASTNTENFDEATRVVPALKKESKKTDTQKVSATGQKDVGTKAAGSITVKNCEDTEPRTLPGGTVFSANGKNFTANNTATVPAGSFSGGGSVCKSASVEVPVTAAENGDSYNLAATAYSSAKLAGNFTISGSSMSGGTSRIVKVVSQQDVDTAKQKIAQNDDAAKEDLKKQLQDQKYTPLTETFSTGNPNVTASPAVGQEGNEVTVTSITTYTMFGARTDDLNKLITTEANKQLDSSKQSIQSTGLDQANLRVSQKNNDTDVQIALQTLVVAGPKLELDQLKREIAGKRRSEVQRIIQERPGVKDVTIDYSPFWVHSTPRKASRISITYDQTQGQ